MTQPKLRIGQLVCVTGIPPILPVDEFHTRELFELCLGRTFPVRGFQKHLIQLDVGELRRQPSYMESIYIEPEFLLPIGRNS
jgi:hypothetical protein